jgi:hypothetical protein
MKNVFLVLVSLMMFIGCESNPYGYGETLGVCEEPMAMNYGYDGANLLNNPCHHCKDYTVLSVYMTCEESKRSLDYNYEIKYISDDFFNLDLDSLWINIDCEGSMYTNSTDLDSVLFDRCCFIDGASNENWKLKEDWEYNFDISIISQDSTYCIFE